MATGALAAALGRMARAVSETLELKDVFARVADATAAVVPFDTMVVFRLEGPGTYALYSFAGIVGERGVIRLQDFSPAIRPSADSPESARRMDDLAEVLDPSFAVDRALAEEGIRSLLYVPLVRGEELGGCVGVGARRPGAFTAEHEAALQAIAGLLGLALEHERLWTLDTARRRRLDAIDALLGVLAGTLDVRGIFNRVSEVVQPVLPHDRLVLTSLSPDRREITLDAVSGEPMADFPTRVGESGACAQVWEYLIADVEQEPEPLSPQCLWCRSHEIRSVLKIPLRLDGGLGALVFLSRIPRQYADEDVVVARRVADHVSLALSHQRLAEEERRTAAARERAARLEARVQALTDELETTRGYHRAIGESKRWKDVLTQAAKVAPTETTVLLTGESGTGKEVVARLIHRASPRAGGPFVALNCAALPETLLESELFGHEKGAFTGATTARPGRIEQAAGGLLFLDEVGEMSPSVQAKILRVLQEREYQRLGGTRSIKADVRVVAATNRDLEAALGRGEFREDLYYRLRVFEIRLPPLRERREDILPLAVAFLQEIGTMVGRPAAGISREARDALLAYPWPGNARELRNALERATILCDGGLIAVEHLPIGVGRPPVASPSGAGGPGAWSADGVTLEAVERDLIARALRQAGNNRSRAARLLGITRSQLYYRIQKHGLDVAVTRASA
jgi:transcriptional regulator with GAF, ATPase, and Fis domain